jgi:DNA polymerase-3 subunit delta'
MAAQAQRLDGSARADAITAWEQASRLAREAVPLQLDPGQVAYALGMHLASLPA